MWTGQAERGSLTPLASKEESNEEWNHVYILENEIKNKRFRSFECIQGAECSATCYIKKRSTEK